MMGRRRILVERWATVEWAGRCGATPAVGVRVKRARVGECARAERSRVEGARAERGRGEMSAGRNGAGGIGGMMGTRGTGGCVAERAPMERNRCDCNGRKRNDAGETARVE